MPAFTLLSLGDDLETTSLWLFETPLNPAANKIAEMPPFSEPYTLFSFFILRGLELSLLRVCKHFDAFTISIISLKDGISDVRYPLEIGVILSPENTDDEILLILLELE